MLSTDNAVLVIIDVQERLLRVMPDKDKLVESFQKLIQGAKVLGVPTVMTEQYPQGLGPTVPEITQLLPEVKPITKVSFSCCQETGFTASLEALKRKQVLMTGIEAHVCVYQTALDLLANGFEVQVVADCVSSRTQFNRDIGLNRICAAGGSVTSVETALFELLRVARGDKFKEISKIVK
jgi:nicotinamidase-related amidase